MLTFDNENSVNLLDNQAIVEYKEVQDREEVKQNLKIIYYKIKGKDAIVSSAMVDFRL